jgi:hypothetical protein
MIKELRPENRKSQGTVFQEAIALFFGCSLWLLIHYWIGVSSATAFLAAGLVAAFAVYWIPPRPHESYLRWSLENLFFIVGFYLAFWKILTLLLQPFLASPLARLQVYLAMWKIPDMLRLRIPYAITIGFSLFVFFSIGYWVLKMFGYKPRISVARWLWSSFLWALCLSFLGGLGG